MFSSSEVVELVQRNNVTHASERQHGGNVAPGDDYLVAPPTAMLGRLVRDDQEESTVIGMRHSSL